MTVQTLFVVKKLSRRIKAENYKLNRLDDLKYKTSQELDGLPKARNGADLIAKIVAEICDKTSLISELKIIRAQCRIELCKLFEKILSGDNFYFELQTVTYRYAFDLSFVNIAERLNYSLQSIYRFHINALSMLGIDFSEVRAEEEFFC